MRSSLRTVLALVALAGAATGLAWQVQRDHTDASVPPVARSSVLVVVRLPTGPLVAVIAAGGDAPGAVVTIPPSTPVTIPGQGQATVADAVALPGPPAAAAISNLLGVWIPHYAITDGTRLAARIDREGGLMVFDERLSGRGVLSALAGTARLTTWREVLRALLWDADPWRAGDFTDADDPALAARLVTAVGRVEVTPLPTSRVPGGALQIDDARAAPMLRPFGRRAATPVPVVVLNGSGVPGVGQDAAVRLIPAGFRIVESDNASSFGHPTTLVVANTADDQQLAERAQAALGVGRVSVAGVPSGLSSVTIVLGKDFRPA
jgi:LytR cell envelope-related transcriptional attenuator